ncbi:MAG: hypothetical protein Q8M07_25475 [Prosthecobacter sp.]|nr:hypothetical protein [Prosthecobacter sp.]
MANALLVLPDGGVIITGRGKSAVGGERPRKGPPQYLSYLWSPETRMWELLAQAGMVGALSVSPLNDKHLCISGREGFVSKDGGKTWKPAFLRATEIAGGERAITETFWSIQKPDTLLLAELGSGSSEVGVFELDLSTGKSGTWSRVERYLYRYERAGEKHFGWLGPTDKTPIKCVVSEDDGKSWQPVTPDQTPWALHAAALAQVEQLVPQAREVRAAVAWAVEIAGTAFCHIESIQEETMDSSQPTLFTSADHGKTWLPAPLDTRTADVQTLFAGSPFVTQDPGGKPIINPNREMKLEFDPKTQRIFAGLNGEWFVTTPADRQWHRINQLPK